MNEVLNGMKVLKLYAWEMAFIRRITDIREKELICIRKKAIVSALSTVVWTFSPILVGEKFWIDLYYIIFLKVCIATFATYVLSSKDNVLTAEKAFVALALFNLLRFPLVVFPSVLNSLIDVSEKISFEVTFTGFFFRQVYLINVFKNFSTTKK